MAGRIDIKIGFACNNLCRFCVQGDKRHRVKTPSTRKVREELEKGRDRADGVVFTGGEPTLRRDLAELVSFARDAGYETIQIQSNGRTFASRRYCAEIIEAGATEFSPALHGHVPELHDYLTRAPGSFAQTTKGIRNLKSLGQYVLTNSVVVRANSRNLPQLARLLVSLGVDQFQLAFVHPVGTAGENLTQIVPRMEIMAPYMMRGLDVGLKAECTVSTEAVPYCILPGYESCVVESRIPDTKVVDGGVTVEDYRAYRVTEGKLKGPDCPDCTHFELCEGPWREYPEKYGFDEFRPVRGA
ncbi:MAG: radical SAM protein [Deltaproteobacteria bacterium]|nr:radical SAM protein [Deltaproteobacteria bacterium]